MEVAMLTLSTEQAEIVNLPLDGAQQVLASAGAGKTRVLTERVRHILKQTKKDGVIALTVTNKAALEMTSRLTDFDQEQDRAWIATIHSVAQRILQKYGHTIGLPSEMHIYDRGNDRMEVFMQFLRDDGVNIDEYLDVTNSKELRNREQNLRRYMDCFSRIKRELLTEQDVEDLYPNKNLWKVFQDYQSSLIDSDGIDYDDILSYAHRILLTHDWVAKIYRSKYKHVCVDEAQDLNKAQYEFIKVLCGDVIRSVLMVGDPNQMIYGFNGSSPDFLCKHFLNDFSPQQFELKKNYRSARAVIKVANKLKPHSQTEIKYALKGRVKIAPFDDEETEANFIVSTIHDLLDLKTHNEIEGQISLDKMVVIARNRFGFNSLIDCLKAKGIPYYLRKGERQSEPSTKFGQVLDYAVRVKLNPKDWVDGRKLCQVLDIEEPQSWTKTVLSDLANQVSALNQDDSELLSKLIIAIDRLDIDSPNIPKLAEEFNGHLTSYVTKPTEASIDEFENVRLSLNELDQFKQTWTRFKSRSLGESLIAFRNASVLCQLSENGLVGGLTLSTVHTMKGLEKDIVFLIGMCEGVFPDYRAKTTEKLDEECNSAFVAVTRAKRWLYITYPKKRVMPWEIQNYSKNRDLFRRSNHRPC